MENAIELEVDNEAGEQNSLFIPESHSVNTTMEITKTELDQSAADNQQSVEMSPDLEENKDRIQGLFAPFSHHMRPDPEYVRLELERSALDQEAATKIIKDRYKWIMECSARRKEKERRNRIKCVQLPHNADQENALKTTQLSHYVDSKDIKKTTQLLHDMHLTPDTFNKDQSEEFSDKCLERIYWHNGLNRFIRLNYVEINTTANISNVDMLNSVTNHHEDRVEDALNYMRNEERSEKKRIIISQISRKFGSAKYKKTTKTFCDENEFIGSSFEELFSETYQNFFEL